MPYADDAALTREPEHPACRAERLAREADRLLQEGRIAKAVDGMVEGLAALGDAKWERNGLYDVQTLCGNEAEVRPRGPAICERIERLSVELGDEAAAAVEKSEFLARLGRSDEAAAEVRRVEAAYGKHPWPWLSMARFRHRQGDSGEARRLAERVLAMPDERAVHEQARRLLSDLT